MRHAVRRRPATVAQVLVAMVVGLSAWGFIDSPNLLRAAIGAPLGTRRTASIDLLRPVARVDAALGLDRLEADVGSAVGRHPLPTASPIAPGGASGRSVTARVRRAGPGAAGGGAGGPASGGAGSDLSRGSGGASGAVGDTAAGAGPVSGSGSVSVPGSGSGGGLGPGGVGGPDAGGTGGEGVGRSSAGGGTGGGGVRGSSAAGGAGGSSGAGGGVATTALPPLRAGTPSDPLRVLIVGDSLAADLGNRLAARLDATGRIATTLDTRPATGLTRPDAFDWLTQLRADLSRVHPDVVVAMWGANDAQGMPLPSGAAAFGSPVWLSTYAARVAAVLTAVRDAGGRLLWVGEPVMRSATFDTRMRQIDGVVQSTLGGGDAVFSNTRAVLATPSGAYADALPDSSGELQLVRATDGIHLTWTGSDRLAAYEVGQLAPWIGPIG